MKNFLQLSTLLLLSLALCVTAINAGPVDPSGLTVTCGDGTTIFLPDEIATCPNGPNIRFTGDNYPHNIHVTVTLDGVLYNDQDFDAVAPQGSPDLLETLSPAGLYEVVITGKVKGKIVVLADRTVTCI